MQSVMHWVGEGFSWVGHQIGDGLGWVATKAGEGLLIIIGNVCRFVIAECHGTFLVFALVGGFVYMCGADKVGMKIMRTSFATFIIMGVLGVLF